jgi:putative nucleotidyltransferase with HDIG domain
MTRPIESLIDGIPSLGSCAGVLDEIETILADPQSTLSDVGDVIEKDPDLTARLLRLGNSSFFGFSTRIETVSETINLIGVQQVQDLISVSTVVEIFDGVPGDLVSMESFWKHSLACGIAARALALARRVPKPEKYFVAGLLHDVGRLVVYLRSPSQAREVFAARERRGSLLRDAEIEVLGFDHSEVGGALLRAWNYPPNLINTVRYHHQPLMAGALQLEASLIHVADYVVNAMQLGSSGERQVPPAHAAAWDRIGLPLDALEGVVDTTDQQLSEVEQAFLGSHAGACA